MMPYLSRRNFIAVMVVACVGAGGAFKLTLDYLQRPSVPQEIIETEFFGSTVARSRIARSGWYPAETWGAWSMGERAELVWPLFNEPAGDVRVLITGRIFPFHTELPQSIRVRINGTEVAVLGRDLEGDLAGGSFWFPRRLLKGREPVRISFEIANPTAPSAVMASQDHRRIGLGLESIVMKYQWY